MALQIGLIGYAINRAKGGIGRYSRELISALRANSQIDLTVLQAGQGELPVETVILPGAARLPGLLTLGQVEIAWIARRRRLEVLHDPTGCLPLMLAGPPCIATIHDVIPYIYPQASTTLDWLIYRFWLPLAIKRMDALITVSNQSKNDIVRYLDVKPEKITMIPEAAHENYRPLPDQQTLPILEQAGIKFPYILYVGSLEPRKNLARLLQAYAALRQWSERWNLVIVGARNYWKSSPLVEIVTKLNLQDRVYFTGFIPEGDLPAIYNGADLFVFPSLYEGFGLPVLEAMACGTPVVTSNCSSLPEIAGDAALLVDPYNINEIASAMQQVLGDADLAADLRKRGLQHASQFTWERTARETIAVYERVLNKKTNENR